MMIVPCVVRSRFVEGFSCLIVHWEECASPKMKMGDPGVFGELELKDDSSGGNLEVTVRRGPRKPGLAVAVQRATTSGTNECCIRRIEAPSLRVPAVDGAINEGSSSPRPRLEFARGAVKMICLMCLFPLQGSLVILACHIACYELSFR